MDEEVWGDDMDEEAWNDDMEDIEPVIDAEVGFLGALESLNPQAIMRCWSDSDTSALVFPGIDVARGPMAISLAWVDIVENTSQLNVSLRPVSCIRRGDLAWTFLAGRLISTHGDETLSIEVYITNIWLREPDGWKLLHLNCCPAPHQPTWLEQRLN